MQTLDHQAEGEREEIRCDEEAAREGAENARKEVRLKNYVKLLKLVSIKVSIEWVVPENVR